jgi:3-methyladenine DNA glycosylase AlkC
MNLKEVYNKEFVIKLAHEINLIFPAFDCKGFIDAIINKTWEEKELKERMRFVSNAIHDYLSIEYKKQIELLIKVSPKFGGLQGLIFPDFVQVYGLNDFPTSIYALEVFTQYSSSEFAIRPFIETYPNEAIQQLLVWSKSENHHVRRLASEGSRPKLPWAPALKEFIINPEPVIPILDNLKNDDSEYVRKSVANHLNDITKTQPELVLALVKEWIGQTANTDWIIKHGLRTLLKKGDKNALAIFKLQDASNLSIKDLIVNKKSIAIGEDLFFNFTLLNDSNRVRNIRVEYKIAYIKANGSISKKVFQLSQLTLEKGVSKSFKRKQRFTDFTTRKHYPGLHEVIIVVNGEDKCSIAFELTK